MKVDELEQDRDQYKEWWSEERLKVRELEEEKEGLISIIKILIKVIETFLSNK